MALEWSGVEVSIKVGFLRLPTPSPLALSHLCDLELAQSTEG